MLSEVGKSWHLGSLSEEARDAWVSAVFDRESRQRVAVAIVRWFLIGQGKRAVDEIEWCGFGDEWVAGKFFGANTMYLEGLCDEHEHEDGGRGSMEFVSMVHRLEERWENRWREFFCGYGLAAGVAVQWMVALWNRVDVVSNKVGFYAVDPLQALASFGRMDVLEDALEVLCAESKRLGYDLSWGGLRGTYEWDRSGPQLVVLDSKSWARVNSIFVDAGIPHD